MGWEGLGPNLKILQWTILPESHAIKPDVWMTNINTPILKLEGGIPLFFPLLQWFNSNYRTIDRQIQILTYQSQSERIKIHSELSATIQQSIEHLQVQMCRLTNHISYTSMMSNQSWLPLKVWYWLLFCLEQIICISYFSWTSNAKASHSML